MHIILSLRILYNCKFILMATSLGTNDVVLTRVTVIYRQDDNGITMHWEKNLNKTHILEYLYNFRSKSSKLRENTRFKVYSFLCTSIQVFKTKLVLSREPNLSKKLCLPSEKVFTLKGKDLLSTGANSFLLEKNYFQNGKISSLFEKTLFRRGLIGM